MGKHFCHFNTEDLPTTDVFGCHETLHHHRMSGARLGRWLAALLVSFAVPQFFLLFDVFDLSFRFLICSFCCFAGLLLLCFCYKQKRLVHLSPKKRNKGKRKKTTHYTGLFDDAITLSYINCQFEPTKVKHVKGYPGFSHNLSSQVCLFWLR